MESHNDDREMGVAYVQVVVCVGQRRGGPAKRRDWLEQLVRGLVDAFFRVTAIGTCEVGT